jgi:hypothetical protein
MGFTSRKGERPNTPGYDAQPQSAPLNMSAFQRQQGVQTPFGSMPSLQAYQNQQDAFVQQFLQNQAQYNQGVMGGRRPEPVELGATWGQAADNIKEGRYQGNPFATGNVDALMGMFGQYGFTPPQGFQDQLLSQLGQQSAPPMYATQPAFSVQRPINPGTGLPYGQPLTDLPIGPNGEYWPAFRSPQQPASPPMHPPTAFSPVMPEGYRPAGTPAMSDKPARGLVPHVLNEGSLSQRTVYVTPQDKQQLTVKADELRRDEQLHYEWWLRNTPEGAAEQENLARLAAQQPGQGGPNGVYQLGGKLAERGQPSSFAPGYGGSINAPPGSMRTQDFRDRDGDMIDDRDQPGPGLPPPGAAQPIPPSQQLSQVDLSQDPGYQQWRQTIRITADYRGPEGERLREQALQRQYLNERGLGGAGMQTPGAAQPIPGVNYSLPWQNNPTQPLPEGMKWQKVNEGSRSEGWLPVPGSGGPGLPRPGAAQPIPPGQQMTAQDDQEFRQYIANASPEDRANFANSWRHLTEGNASDAAKAAREQSLMQMMAQDMRGGAGYVDAFNRAIERLGPEPMRKIPSYDTVGPRGPRAYSDAELRSLFDQKKLAERAAPTDQPSTIEFLRSQGLIELDEEGAVRETFAPGRASPIPTRTSGTKRGTSKTEDDDTPKPLRASPGSSGPGWRESGGFRIYDGYTDPRGTGVIGSDTTRPGERRDPVTGQRLYDPYTDPVATGGARIGGAYRSPSNNNTWGPPTRRKR